MRLILIGEVIAGQGTGRRRWVDVYVQSEIWVGNSLKMLVLRDGRILVGLCV